MNVGENEERWERNYFNYFTEIEEHFQKARGTGLFLVSPLDWALIESWKNAGIPLEAVLRGIDKAFEKWRAKKTKTRKINSLAYCTQAVMEEAESMAGVVSSQPPRETAPPFDIEDLRRHLTQSAAQLRDKKGDPYQAIAAAIEKLLDDIETHYENLEELEQRLTAIEEKMTSLARIEQSEETLFRIRRELDSQLRQYRGKMTASQITMLEKQYLDQRLLEEVKLPRLSLFYLR